MLLLKPVGVIRLSRCCRRLWELYRKVKPRLAHGPDYHFHFLVVRVYWERAGGEGTMSRSILHFLSPRSQTSVVAAVKMHDEEEKPPQGEHCLIYEEAGKRVFFMNEQRRKEESEHFLEVHTFNIPREKVFQKLFVLFDIQHLRRYRVVVEDPQNELISSLTTTTLKEFEARFDGLKILRLPNAMNPLDKDILPETR